MDLGINNAIFRMKCVMYLVKKYISLYVPDVVSQCYF